MEVLVNQGVSELPSRFILPAQFRTSAAQPIQIPLIDLAQLGDAAGGRPRAMDQIHRACCDWGFFQVLNHGVSLQALDSLRAHVKEFLALPTDVKGELGFVQGDDGQGFGTGFVNPQIGTPEWKDYLILHTSPLSLRNYSKWPPMLRDDIKMVSAEILNLSKLLLAVFSENLQLPPSYIEDAIDVLHQKVLIAHYLPCPQPDLAVGAGEHTDVGVITCVWQASEDVVGLQVRKDGKWYSVEPLPGAIVVNVADQVEIISNGLYKSGPHRVVLDSSKPRISVVCFHNPSGSAVISPAPTLVDSNHPPNYAPTTFKPYAAKFAVKAV